MLMTKKKPGMIYQGEQVTLVYPGRTFTTNLPEDIHQRFLEEHRKGEEAAVELVQIFAGGRATLTSMSRYLSGLFGVRHTEIFSAAGELCRRRNISQLDYPQIRDLADEMEKALVSSFGDRSRQRAVRGVEEAIADPTSLDVELLGWRGLMESEHSELLDHRENHIEGTLEALYQYQDAKFLVATCRTGKVVVIRVGSESESCEYAQAWLAADTVEQFTLPQFFSRGRT